MISLPWVFTDEQLEEHNKYLRDKTIDECKQKLEECWLNGTVANRIVKELQDSLEQLK